MTHWPRSAHRRSNCRPPPKNCGARSALLPDGVISSQRHRGHRDTVGQTTNVSRTDGHRGRVATLRVLRAFVVNNPSVFEGRRAVALEIRRVVTGHDANGKAIVASDERMNGVSAPARPYISRCEIWSTDKMPVDNSEAEVAAQKKGFVVRHNYVGSGQGSGVP